MFITTSAFRSPLSDLLRDPTEQYWVAAELALQHPWFLVTFRHSELNEDGNAFEANRTMLLSNVRDVENLAQQETGGTLHFESAYVITPGHLNGTDGWKMEPLNAVWMAEEPSAVGQVAEIYETRAGLKHVRSMLETPIEELRNAIVRFRLPNRESVNKSCTPLPKFLT